MTVSISDNKVQYVGDGGQIAFPYTFRVLDESHMVVTVDGVVTSDYTMTGIGDDGGGEVQFTSAPANGADILLYRAVPIDQLIDYVPYDPFPAETHELGLDKLTMICQQLQEQVDRALKVPADSSDLGFELDVPPVSERPNAVLHFDDTGNILRADYEIGNYKGYWATATLYKARQTLSDPATENLYVVLQDHTATDLASDVTSGYIHKAMDFATTVQKRDEAVQAADQAAISEGNAADSETAAGLSEAAAAISETNAYNWAQADVDVPVDDGTNPSGFSSYHWSKRAEDFINQGGAISVSRTIVNSTGDFITDLNATDFTGDQQADDTVTTALRVTVNMSLSFSYDGVFYSYQGVKPTLIGVGGTTQVLTDYAILTTAAAAAVSFDASAYPGSTVDNVQDAIDALATRDASSIAYDNTQGFPTGTDLQATTDELGQLIRYMGQWAVGDTINGSLTLAETIGNPPLYQVIANSTVVLPADTNVALGEVFAFVCMTGDFTLAFDEGTHAQTITPPPEKGKTYRAGNGAIITLTYMGSNSWLLYGDCADA